MTDSRRERVLGIDVGATTTRAAVLEDGAVLARDARPTPYDGDAAVLTANVVDLAEQVLSEARACERNAIAAIGIASVGPVDTRTGVLYGPPNLGARYRMLDLAGPLRERFAVPVFIERDTNVAALGEHAFGAARDAQHFLYFTVSTGIGGAVVTDGRLFRGATGIAGELGHFPVELGGPLCGCGHRGHLEALSSGSGIAQAGREAVEAGTLRLDDLGVADASALTARDVARAERGGAPAAVAIMTRARTAFAAAVVGYVNVFDPELIVVGGGLGIAEGERLLAPARAAVEQFAMRPASGRVEIVAAELGDDSGLLGCVALVAGAGRPTLGLAGTGGS